MNAPIASTLALLADPNAARIVELVEPGRALGGPNWPAALASLAGALVLIAAAAAVWRRSAPETPEDQAFRLGARWLGLRRRERALVREMAAAHGRAAPVALLLSEHAFREAAAALWARATDPRVGAATARLMDRVHGR